MPTKEITCSCGFRDTIRYFENDLMIYCGSCGLGHPLSHTPFQSRVALTEDGLVVSSEAIKKGELIERCPLSKLDINLDWGFRNNKGDPVIPLGLILRYNQTEDEPNVILEIREHFLFVFALSNIEKHQPLSIRKAANV